MKIISALSLILLIVSMTTSSALAANRCSDLFKDSEAAFQKSEKYRNAVLPLMEQVQKALLWDRGFMRSEYNEAILRFRKVSDESIQKVLDDSPALRGLPTSRELPPPVGSELRKAYEDAGIKAPQFFKRANEIAYLKWLKINALIGPSDKSLPAVRIGPGHSVRPATVEDPIRLLSELRSNGVSYSDALLEIRFRFDPTLSPEMTLLAKQILELADHVKVVSNALEPFYNRSVKLGYAEAWLLMPSLPAGQKALQQLRADQVAEYGALFSRASYERVMMFRSSYRPSMDVIAQIRNELALRQPEADVFAKHAEALRILSGELGASSNLSGRSLYRLVDLTMAGLRESSYEYVLARVLDSEFAAAKLVALGDLVEIADAFRSERRGLAYIQMRVDGIQAHRRGSP